MKKIALLLAAVTIMLTLVACGYRCHSCGDSENLKKYGDNIYCASCIEEGKTDIEDQKRN